MKKQLQELTKVLQSLSKQERECIIFKYYSNKSLEEISKITNISLVEVKIIHDNAVKKLENKLDFLRV